MKLANLRRLSVRSQVRIRFSLPNHMQCVVNEHGVAEIPELRSAPDFSLEDALASATEFTLESAAPVLDKKTPRPRVLSRDELAAMTAESAGSTAAHDDHDE
jgi:hypothetical protein